MSLSLIDWIIIASIFIPLGAIAIYSRKYTLTAADFLTGNRLASRYMLGGAEYMAMISATMMIAQFEVYRQGGFPILWWSMALTAIGLAKSLSGWVIYRFRETRALTMAQFFEMRYSRKFRIFTGMLAWGSGIVNYAIHPAITSRLIVYFCGLPPTVQIWGVEIRTMIIVMVIMLTAASIITLFGGQIALMVTDFLQFQLVLVVVVVTVVYLLLQFGWSNIVQTLQLAPSGKSMLNPFDQVNVPDFNIWYFAMLGFFHFYQEMAFQGNQGYFGAARSPHEAKMGRLLGVWRGMPILLFYSIPPIIAYVVFNNPDYSLSASFIQDSVLLINEPYVQNQMSVPFVLRYFLPVGLTGFLVASFLASSISTDDTYLHAWGSIFIQDIIMPLRKSKKRLTSKEHLKWLRLSVILVAMLALIGGSLVPIRDYIMMYFQITFAIYAAGAGSAIIGGLYWKKGTAAGAWTAVISGAVLCSIGFILKTFWMDIPLLVNMKSEAPFHGMHVTLVASLTSVMLYIIVSLLTTKKPFNIEKLLNRGQYAVKNDHVQVQKKISLIRKLTGIDHEFTTGDKFIAAAGATYILGWSIVAWGGTFINLVIPIPETFWPKWWGGVTVFLVVCSIATSIWFFLGGMRDLRIFFNGLKTMKRDENDDGTVSKEIQIDTEHESTSKDELKVKP